MMKTRESGLWRWLEKANIVFGPRLHMQRIENSVERGTPDVDAVLDACGFVIELKSVARPKRGGPIHTKLSADQAMFLLARRRAGGRAYLLIKVDDNRYLISGEHAGELEKPISETRLVTLSLIARDARPHDVLNIAARRN